MNIFTRFLAQFRSDRAFLEFIEYWDRLEALALRVYKAGTVSNADQAEWQLVRAWLQDHYPQWAEDLRPLWQQALVNGAPPAEDPFLFLLAPVEASAFLNNWSALQHLPAAREAINRLLVAQGE